MQDRSPDLVGDLAVTQMVEFLASESGKHFLVHPRLRTFAGESAFRCWLYEDREEDLRLEELSEALIPENLLQEIRNLPRARSNRVEVQAFRSRWEASTQSKELGFEGTVARWVADRILRFLDCDGLIPIVDQRKGDAFPIPFKLAIGNRAERRGFVGLNGSPFRSKDWDDILDKLSIQVGWNLHVTILAQQREGDGEFEDGSFALPLLLAWDRMHPGQKLCNFADPLQVITSGSFKVGPLKEVNGVSAKASLAERIGAKLFACPGVAQNGERILNLEVGDDIDRVLAKIGRRLNCPPAVDGAIVDRPWLLDMIREQEAEKGDARIALLTGEPGIGKSTFLKSFSRNHEPADTFTFDYRQGHKSALELLKEQYRLLYRRDPHEDPNRPASSDIDAWRNRVEILLSNRRPLLSDFTLLTIDALDEASDRNEAIRAIPTPNDPQVFLLVSSRTRPVPVPERSRFHEILPGNQANLNDAAEYLRLRKPQFPEDRRNNIINAASGNFLVIHYLLNGIELGVLEEDEIDDLLSRTSDQNDCLSAIYDRFRDGVHRRLKNGDERRAIDILSGLVAYSADSLKDGELQLAYNRAREGLQLPQVSVPQMIKLLLDASLLRRECGRLRLWHATYSEYVRNRCVLTADVSSLHRSYVGDEPGVRPGASQYALQYTLHHLTEILRLAEPASVESEAARGDLHRLLTDLNTVEFLLECGNTEAVERGYYETLTHWPGINTLSDLRFSDPVTLIQEAGKESANDLQLDLYAAIDPRLSRIAVFEDFLKRNRPLLYRFPRELENCSWNDSLSGAVREAVSSAPCAPPNIERLNSPNDRNVCSLSRRMIGKETNKHPVAISLADNDRLLIVGFPSGTVEFWDSETLAFRGHFDSSKGLEDNYFIEPGVMRTIATNADGSVIASLLKSDRLLLWKGEKDDHGNLEVEELGEPITLNRNGLTELAICDDFTHDGVQIVTAGADPEEHHLNRGIGPFILENKVLSFSDDPSQFIVSVALAQNSKIHHVRLLTKECGRHVGLVEYFDRTDDDFPLEIVPLNSTSRKHANELTGLWAAIKKANAYGFYSESHDGQCYAMIALRPSGRVAVSNDSCGNFYIWGIESPQRLRTISTGLSDATAMAISKTGRYLFTGHSGEGGIRKWDLFAPNRGGGSGWHLGEVNCLCSMGNNVFSGGSDGRVIRWRIGEDCIEACEIAKPNGPVSITEIRYSADQGGRLICLSSDLSNPHEPAPELSWYDIGGERLKRESLWPFDSVDCMDASGDGSVTLIAGARPWTNRPGNLAGGSGIPMLEGYSDSTALDAISPAYRRRLDSRSATIRFSRSGRSIIRTDGRSGVDCIPVDAGPHLRRTFESGLSEELGSGESDILLSPDGKTVFQAESGILVSKSGETTSFEDFARSCRSFFRLTIGDFGSGESLLRTDLSPAEIDLERDGSDSREIEPTAHNLLSISNSGRLLVFHHVGQLVFVGVGGGKANVVYQSKLLSEVVAVGFSPDDRKVVAISRDGLIYFYQVNGIEAAERLGVQYLGGPSNGELAFATVDTVCAAAGEEVIFFKIGGDTAPPITTTYKKNEREWGFQCPSCGANAAVMPIESSRKILNIEEQYGSRAAQNPCFFLPHWAWEDDSLKVKCAHCGSQVRLNPFPDPW